MILEKSKEVVPLDQGPLQDSGAVDKDEGTKQVSVYYDTPYAAIQHENLEYSHNGNRTAKYLENPTLENAPKVFDIVVEEIKKEL